MKPKAAETAAEFAPWRWPKVFSDVHEGLKQLRQAHAASQKLAAMVYPTIATLGESEDDVQVAVLRLLHEIHEETDPDVRKLCSSLKTDALSSIFPSGETETLATFWGASAESVEESIGAKPPPSMEGVELEDIEKTALSAAQAAFGAVMGTSEHRKSWRLRRRRRSDAADFGDGASALTEALAWLRESVMWVISRVWRHVYRFAFVAAMIAAVVLTYCAIMGRGYTSE